MPYAIVSPWARRHYVSHEVFDHTECYTLVEANWNLPAMTYRDANANPMLDMLDFRHPAFLQPQPWPSRYSPPTLAPWRATCLARGRYRRQVR